MLRAKRNQPKPSLDNRLALEALRLKETAKTLRHGPKKLSMLRKARQLEIAIHINEWLSSPGLQAPK
jgi:hypothetical protein